MRCLDENKRIKCVHLVCVSVFVSYKKSERRVSVVRSSRHFNLNTTIKTLVNIAPRFFWQKKELHTSAGIEMLEMQMNYSVLFFATTMQPHYLHYTEHNSNKRYCHRLKRIII